MARTKALSDKENETLRGLVRAVLDDARFNGNQTALADECGVSQPHISNMLKHGRGGGIHSLRAIARYRPVETMQFLGIRLDTLIALWEAEHEGMGEQVVELPIALRRAARAAVELWGYHPDDVYKAAKALLAEGAPTDGDEREFGLLSELKRLLPPRTKSGVRRKTPKV